MPPKWRLLASEPAGPILSSAAPQEADLDRSTLEEVEQRQLLHPHEGLLGSLVGELLAGEVGDGLGVVQIAQPGDGG